MKGRVSRRTVLKVGVTGASGVIAGCSQSGQDSDGATPESGGETEPLPSTTAPDLLPDDLPSSYIERDGTDFVVDGDRYVFAGVANCCLVKGYTSRTRVQDVLDGAAALGADALRFKIGCAGSGTDCGGTVDGCYVCFQPDPGTFEETSFEHLDYVIAEAGNRGIRVILPLVDNWGRSGMDRYVVWSDTASTHDDFYTDDQIQEWYRGFVEALLTRENTHTGREYREDPTILMWELANEPRYENDYEGFLEWVEETAGFIHDLDANHLVSTGSDVYQDEPYEEIHAIDGIDACSIHLWPQNWGRAENAESFGTEYITDRVERGRENVGKPVYLGEYGWRVNLQSDEAEAQLQRRTDLFQEWHDAALSADIDGALAWELLSDSRLRYHREEPGEGETVGFAYPDHTDTVQELESFMKEIQTAGS